MKIVEEYENFQADVIEIKSATYIEDYAIKIVFGNGVNRLVDFKPFLESSLHPSIRVYLDEIRFNQFKIVDGNLNWNDYDMIFPVYDLYAGKL